MLYSQTNRSHAYNNNDLQSDQSTKRTLKLPKNTPLHTGVLCKTSERTQAHASVKSFEEQLKNIEIDLISESNPRSMQGRASQIKDQTQRSEEGVLASSKRFSSREVDLLARQASSQSMKSLQSLNSSQRAFL